VLLPSNSRRPLLCYVTDRRSLAGASPSQSVAALLSAIRVAAEAGIDWIQIREKDLSGNELSLLTGEALHHAAATLDGPAAPPRIIVNDRLDVAIVTGAGGVHLGEGSLPVREAKQLLYALSPNRLPIDDFLVGVSCHSLEAAKAAARDGADYIFFGPVFATPSKAAFGQPQGLARLAEVSASASIPVLAIGGITMENIPSCLAAGASGIAAIRLFQGASGVPQVVETLRKLTP
jgi:thiamine-phosphate pyrophosphorylase